VDPADWRDDDVVGAWSSLLRLHARLVPTIDAELHRVVGLPLAWYDVLLELNAAADRRLRMLDLGEAVVLSRTRVSRVVDELERAGHVARQPNPDDGRSAFAVLTPSGRALLRKAAPVYLDTIRRQLGEHLSGRDARELRRILDTALLAARAPG
jgi:DNA-binding MarR family transcriptional regulator